MVNQILLFRYLEMSDKRKLQGEMDRCFKKILEGVEAFDDTFKKLQHATNTNQKDKHESDLKKEIKKLQRLRDQIKSWASGNDVKDKKLLLDYRKLIEERMERFKVAERETKTKAYSKEGLGLAVKIDPAQKAKDDTMQWLHVTIEALNRQIELFESEIEYSSHSRKKKVDREKQDRLDDLRRILEKHRSHVKNLETLMRMLDNQTIKPHKINVIRDDIEYYLEACQEPDYEHNDFMYEDMGLDDSISNNIAGNTNSPVDRQLNSSVSSLSKDDEEAKVIEPVLSTVNHNSSASKEESTRKRNKSDEVISPLKPNNSAPKTVVSRSALSFPSAPVSSVATKAPQKSLFSSTAAQPYAAAAACNAQSNSSNHVTNLLDQKSDATSEISMQSTIFDRSEHNAWPIKNHVPLEVNGTSELDKEVSSIASSVTSMLLTNGDTVSTSPSSSSSASVVSSAETAVPSSTPLSSTLSNEQVSMPFVQNGDVTNVENVNSLNAGIESSVTLPNFNNQTSLSAFTRSTSDSVTTTPLPANTNHLSSYVQKTDNMSKQKPGANGEANIMPFLGVAPLGPIRFTKEQDYQQSMVEACWRHMPHPSDSERLRHYLPRNMCPTPTYYPQAPISDHDSLEFYLRLSTETLFFIFYYMEATKAQYMAAKALKKQSWRFHTKYMMWFQRHEEPKTITDEFEQGTYIYFDYERWGQRKKEGFTFEYRFLEDRELQ